MALFLLRYQKSKQSTRTRIIFQGRATAMKQSLSFLYYFRIEQGRLVYKTYIEGTVF